MRVALVLVPAAVVAGALVGRTVPTTAAVLGSLATGVLVAAYLHARESRRVRSLAQEMNAWLGVREHRPVSLSGSPHWRELQVAVNAVGAAYERRGEKLRREGPWRRDLVDALVGPGLLFSSSGRLLAANADARESLGLPADGSRPTLVQALGSSILAGAAKRALETGQRVTVDATLTDREVRAVVSVVGEEVLLLLTDRTEQRRTEEVRRDFVVNASHELKTPAAAIQALCEALEVVAERDPGRVPELAERLRGESERLVEVVGDLLDLRRLEDGAGAERQPVDLVELCRRSLAGAATYADGRDVSLHLDAPDQAVVVGVSADLRLVVDNLVRNAVRYNRAGGRVAVTVSRTDGSYELAVADTGIGIPQHDLARIFERFYRVDDDRSRDSGGTGLGLAIVKHAVEVHRGTIRVESLLGEGTTFVVRLPIEPRTR